MSVGLAWKSAANSNEKLVNQNYATLFVFWIIFSIPYFKGLTWEIWNMKKKLAKKNIIKAQGHILFGLIFFASDFT